MYRPASRPLKEALLPTRLNRLKSGGFTLMELLVVIVIVAALAALVVSNVDQTRDDAEIIAAKATMQRLREAITGSASAPGYLADMKHIPGFRLQDLRPHDLLAGSSYPLFDTYDPVARRGWRGPYLRNAQGVANTNPARNGLFPAGDERRFPGDKTFAERGFFYSAASSFYGVTNDLTVADPWGNPIVIQIPPASAFTPAESDPQRRFEFARLVSAGPDGELTTPLDRLAGLLADGTKPLRGDDLVVFLNRADVYEAE